MADILLGQLPNGTFVTLPGGGHVALYAPTESGKGTGFVLPNAFAWPGSMVVLDVKGEVFEATAGHRKVMGQEIYRFDPAAADGRSHHCPITTRRIAPFFNRGPFGIGDLYSAPLSRSLQFPFAGN
jgi:type IV secretion system protein VirD4